MGNAAMLVGAGVSMLPPCSLPSGPQLRNMLVHKVSASSLTRAFWKRIQKQQRYQYLVPEIVFQRMFETVAERLFPFFDLLKNAQHNTMHRAIATVAERYHCPIFTTNFDTLIEDQCTKPAHITHLHGGLTDGATMITRINQVGRGLHDHLRSTFQQSLSGKSLYVMGYSGNDTDIIDAINVCKVLDIVWLVRDAKHAPTIDNIRRLTAASETRVVQMDLCDVAMELTRSLGIPQVRARRNAAPAKQSLLRSWQNSITIAERCAFLHKLCLEIEEYRCCVEICRTGANHPDAVLHTQEWFRSEQANCLRILGRYRQGLRVIERAIKTHSRSSKSPLWWQHTTSAALY